MLVNALKLDQRGKYGFSSEGCVALFENNLSRLHTDDQALLDHFGVGREQLVSHINSPLDNEPLPIDGDTVLNALKKKLARLDSINMETNTSSSDKDNFYWFGYRFFFIPSRFSKRMGAIPMRQHTLMNPLFLQAWNPMSWPGLAARQNKVWSII